MNNEIKQGDTVRVSKDVPRIYMKGWGNAVEYRVYSVEGDAAAITYGRQELVIPTKYLVKVDAEAKEAKRIFYGDYAKRASESLEKLKRKTHPEWYSSTEPTEQTEKTFDDQIRYVLNGVEHQDFGRPIQTEMINLDINEVAKEYAEAISNAIRKYGDALCKHGTFIRMVDDLYKRDLAKEMEGCDSFVSIKEKIRNLHREDNQGLHFNPFRCNNFANAVGESDYWKHYTADLAKEIVLKTVNSASDRRPMAIAEYAVSVAKAVVEGLKRK